MTKNDNLLKSSLRILTPTLNLESTNIKSNLPALLHNLNTDPVLHQVDVREDPPPADDEPAAAQAVMPHPMPWQQEVRLRVHTEHLHHRLRCLNIDRCRLKLSSPLPALSPLTVKSLPQPLLLASSEIAVKALSSTPAAVEWETVAMFSIPCLMQIKCQEFRILKYTNSVVKFYTRSLRFFKTSPRTIMVHKMVHGRAFPVIMVYNPRGDEVEKIIRIGRVG